jgi:hypothetical protein
LAWKIYALVSRVTAMRWLRGPPRAERFSMSRGFVTHAAAPGVTATHGMAAARFGDVPTTLPRAVLLVAVTATCVVGFAEWHAMQPTARAPQLLTGELWQQMSRDAKIAFVAAIADLLDIELSQAGAAVRKPVNDVVRQVDTYYATYPGELERPVIETIVQGHVTGGPE